MSIIAKICQWALEEHIGNQWKWPRESDLVADLVFKIKSSLGENAESPFTLVQRERNENSKEINHTRTTIVRTEAKINDRHQKVDVCILKNNPTYCFGNFGPRDILLRVDSKDVDEVLEVKLDPHPLGYWINDICKLEMLHNEFRNICFHLLAMDNSLILGRALRKSKRSSNVWPWPLEPKHITINNFKIKSKPAQMVNISLKHVSLPLKEQLRPGVFLWALGVTQIEPVITASATCWKLDDIAWRSNQA